MFAYWDIQLKSNTNIYHQQHSQGKVKMFISVEGESDRKARQKGLIKYLIEVKEQIKNSMCVTLCAWMYV